jgi:hypothetical protein
VAAPSEMRKVLLQAVDDGLSVPGDIVKAAIYDRVEKSYRLKREEIPDQLEAFHRALEDLLGDSTKVVERLISRSLYNRLELPFAPHENWTLLDYVNHANKRPAGD